MGRGRECETLTGLVAAVKAGRSRVLVVRGEAGIGKTALLDFLVDRAAGCRVCRAAGVESEMELAYAGLHQLCGPYLERLDRLPAPQGLHQPRLAQPPDDLVEVVVGDAVRIGDLGDGTAPARGHPQVHEDAEREVGVPGVLHVRRHGVMVSPSGLEKW